MQRGLQRKRPSVCSRSSPPAPRHRRPVKRSAVYGSTSTEGPKRHFLGWLGEVDPDELFASGAAYGITVVRRATGEGSRGTVGSLLQDPRAARDQ